MGVKTVVNLRSFHSDKDLLRGTGLACVDLDMKAWHAEQEDVLRFLKIVADTNGVPVFVHCQHGADRTGTLCAIYRMVVQGWMPKEAAREMTEGGYGFHPLWVNLERYVEDFDVKGAREKAGLKP